MYDINILIPNYNNGNYLEKCLDSIFSQNMNNFSFLVLINDDKSTDNSIQIIQKYIDLYQDKIILLQNEKNKGLLYTITVLYKNVNSKYFTVLDSDDYWIDNNYLSRAINFLNEKKDYSIYGENTKILDTKTNKISDYWETSDKIFCFNIIKNSYNIFCPHTSSTVYRSKIDNELINKLEKIADEMNKGWQYRMIEHAHGGDYFRNTYFSDGLIMCKFTNFAGCYRLHYNNSRWTSLSQNTKDLLCLFVEYNVANTLEFSPINYIKIKYFLNKFLHSKKNIKIHDITVYKNFNIKKDDIVNYLNEMEKKAYDKLKQIEIEIVKQVT